MDGMYTLCSSNSYDGDVVRFLILYLYIFTLECFLIGIHHHQNICGCVLW